MVARVFWEDLVSVQVRVPRHKRIKKNKTKKLK